MADDNDRIRINRVPVLGLLALAACGGEATAPPLKSAPVGAARSAPAAVPEVDDLFRWLDEQDQVAPPAVVYTIPRVSPEIAATELRAAELSAYRENLEVCLDGRFSAFCDHNGLSAPDAARVREAEHQSNLVTCIDPKWQHLCRPELLPEPPPAPSPAMAAPRP